MKLFAITSNVPHKHHNIKGVTAVHIVSWALLESLLELGHEVVLQIIFNPLRREEALSREEQESLKILESKGVSVASPIYPREYYIQAGNTPVVTRASRFLRRLALGSQIQDFYSTLQVRGRVSEAVQTSRADAVLTIWSPEGVAATHGLSDVPRVSFQGDIDFTPAEAHLRDRVTFERSGQSGGLWMLRQQLGLSHFKQAHMRLMSGVDVIACVTATNATFYTQHGHSRSVYIRNTWPDPGAEGVGGDIEESYRRLRLPDHTVKIIGHVGNLNSTGSTYGIEFLLDTLPYLEEAMGGLDYQVHIIGGGEIVSSLKDRLKHKRLVVRGFVQDLDAEFKTSDVLLLLNNASPYHKAAYTRHIIAWATGLCLIAHADSQSVIPEIRHMENALIGSTPKDVAQLVKLASTDPDLNRRVRKGGRATYEEWFTPQKVMKALVETIPTVDARASRP